MPASGTPWQPATGPEALRARARLYRHIRDFFGERGVLEVQTPVLGTRGVTEPHIHCIAVPGHGWLQPSPEYHMKRLLAAGSGPIYQITPVFRAHEHGRQHNPEFTMLEWYRPGFRLDAMIEETLALMEPLLAPQQVRHVRFRELFREHTGLDPLTAPTGDLLDRIRQREQNFADEERATLVDYLLSRQVEPALPPEQLTVVTDFPGWVAALAETATDDDGATVARRFEVYFRGLELANGYQELTDPTEQRARFEQDRALRSKRGAPDMAPDEKLLAALEAGLPQCSGVALGIERVLMAWLGVDAIEEVLAFSADRA